MFLQPIKMQELIDDQEGMKHIEISFLTLFLKTFDTMSNEVIAIY